MATTPEAVVAAMQSLAERGHTWTTHTAVARELGAPSSTVRELLVELKAEGRARVRFVVECPRDDCGELFIKSSIQALGPREKGRVHCPHCHRNVKVRRSDAFVEFQLCGGEAALIEPEEVAGGVQPPARRSVGAMAEKAGAEISRPDGGRGQEFSRLQWRRLLVDEQVHQTFRTGIQTVPATLKELAPWAPWVGACMVIVVLGIAAYFKLALDSSWLDLLSLLPAAAK